MVYILGFFSSKCSLFHNSNVFGSCTIHILYTECAKIKKNNSGAKSLISRLLILDVLSIKLLKFTSIVYDRMLWNTYTITAKKKLIGSF